MSFFEGLCKCMGSSSYTKYMDALADYLGPYGIIMNMTCKGMKEFPFRKGQCDKTRYIRSCSFESNGHLDLLKWWYEGRNHIDTYSWRPRHLDVLKWKLNVGLQDTDSLFVQACRHGTKEVIDFCIDNRLVAGAWLHIDNVEILDYLYRVRRLPIEGNLNMWERGFYLRDEDVYIWALQYQHDSHLAFSEYFNVHIGHIDRMVEHWAHKGFKNIQMMSRILTREITAEEWLLSRDVCNVLTYEVAVAIQSDWCMCDDPANHEHRKRIKN